MNVKVQMHNPDDMEVTLSVTMPLKDLRKLNTQLCTDWPSGEVSTAIRFSIRDAEQAYGRQIVPPKSDTPKAGQS